MYRLKFPLKYSAVFVVTLLTLPLAGGLSGCQTSAEAQQEGEQRESGGRIASIVKQSGGDWDKVSAQDKQYIVKDLSGGDERSGKMLFEAKAGKLRITRRPSGPPRAVGR